MFNRLAVLLSCLIISPVARAQNDSGPEGLKPLVVWQFDGAAEPGLGEKPKLAETGPRPPHYPSFSATNTAKLFDGSGITIRESDLPQTALRFQTGETVTLEAWVRVQQIKEGDYVYLIGKGRTKSKGYPEKNQNYALRLQARGGDVRATFLFASAVEKDKPSDWHRWTSETGFTLDDRWHHIAVSYTFGKPESIRGVIDGRVRTGAWDMGGATTRGPVLDDDSLQLGTGNGGGPSNSFRGWLDNVRIWRGAVPEVALTGAYEYISPPPAIRTADLVPGQVLVQICEEGLPGSNAWPDIPPKATESYREEAFGLFELPHKYVDTGVRGDRPNPFLLRASAKVNFPAGEHRILLRARGSARLYIDGKLLLSTPFPPQDSSGHNPVTPADQYLNLGPDFRFAPPGNRESWIAFKSMGRDHVVILETIVGGFIGKAKKRPELGETVVALSRAGSDSWELMTPGNRSYPFTDEGWATYHTERSSKLDEMNTLARKLQRDRHAEYWNHRRSAANEWLKSTAEVPVPPLPKSGNPQNNPIDYFLAATLDRVTKQNSGSKRGTIDYFAQVQPILESRCTSCHAGTHAKGGLRLDDRTAALSGGKNDGPAVTPNDPTKSALLVRVKSRDETEQMPPKGDRLTEEQVRLIETWIREGATWPDLNPRQSTVTPLSSDLVFLRRVYLDVLGIVPTRKEITAFEANPAKSKRAALIDQLLADPRAADHAMGYWLDLLAENPNILNPTLNNTGPFRWWLYETFRDNKPADLWVTELIRQGGSERFGGPAGFRVASQNDAPFAQKGTIIGTAFLGVEMKCARCHDSPSNKSTQRDLFQLAAMLSKVPQKVLPTSSVPQDKLHEGGRKPLIRVTLAPGSEVAPKWSFPEFASDSLADKLAEDPQDSRDRLAALITAPQNQRFAQVMVNRIWQRLLGRGLVEPVDDWERGKPSHPELLNWLAREFVRSGYDMQQIQRLILNSHAYQRASDPNEKEPGVLFAAPVRRRLTAEQIVDSLFIASGKPFRVEEASLDIDGIRDLGNSISLGQPRRSWMLTSTSNERDRPSLALPRIQAVTDVLAALGWRVTRQDPISVRDHNPNVLQPAILSNGVVANWLTRLSDDHATTTLAIEAKSPEEFVDALFLQVLTRRPTPEELAQFSAYLKNGFSERRQQVKQESTTRKRLPVPYVSWSNHLDPKATLLRQKQEADAREGDPVTKRLDPKWRTKAEDVLWALLNSPEFLFTP